MFLANLIIFVFNQKNIFCQIVSFFLTFSNPVVSQTLFFQDIIHGGVTADGYNSTISLGAGNFNLNIQPGSTIRQAFLFCGRYGKPPDISVNFNGTSLNIATIPL